MKEKKRFTVAHMVKQVVEALGGAITNRNCVAWNHKVSDRRLPSCW